MSDPVTNLEIEDVLASIRRLVTQADKPADPPESPSKQGAGLFSGRLVLTPALRVSDDESEPESGDSFAPVQPELVDGAEAAKTGEGALFFSDRRRLEQTIAALEAAVARQGDEWEPDGSEDEAAATELDPKLAEVLAAAGQEDAPEPADPAQDDAAGPDAVFSHHGEDAPEDTAPHPAETAATDPLGEDEEYYEDEIALEFDPESEPDAELDHELSSYLEGVPTLEEDALRDLVIQIVRAELHGAMGERITANVRKLVRKEINRALASRELE